MEDRILPAPLLQSGVRNRITKAIAPLHSWEQSEHKHDQVGDRHEERHKPPAGMIRVMKAAHGGCQSWSEDCQ